MQIYFAGYQMDTVSEEEAEKWIEDNIHAMDEDTRRMVGTLCYMLYRYGNFIEENEVLAEYFYELQDKELH